MNYADEDIVEFSKLINQTFQLSLASKASNTLPLDLGVTFINKQQLKETQINNLLIKSKGESIQIPDLIDSSITLWINECLKVASRVCNDLEQRYAYLTIDNKAVKKGRTQRQGGWHIDGLQGDEVPKKLNNCFQFILVSNTPTEFCKQTFDVSEINISKDNVFKALSKQINSENNTEINNMHTYLMHCFHVHRASKSKQNTERLFLRLYLSHCPVTNNQATLNPKIKYPFVPHSTTGQIPSHLTP